MNSGALLALLSATLFGLSTPLTKIIIGDFAGPILAGLLYLGSGVGLLFFSFFQKSSSWSELFKLPRRQKIKLIGAIISGGILAPLFLVYGILGTSSFEVSLLLNLETVATTLIAFLIFKEHVSPRVWFGKVLVLAGSSLVIFESNLGANALTLPRFSTPALCVVMACLFWAIDNNLTRAIESLSPTVLASAKGLVAGTFNLLLGISLTHVSFFSMTFSLKSAALVLIIGALCYGLSLVLFIRALRMLGTSRAITYFATGPFIGMAFSVILVEEHPQFLQLVAGGFAFFGVVLLYFEKHDHLHTHEPLTHSHPHTHDEHHQHTHEGTEGSEPHIHLHRHELLSHSHPHVPDIHHRHRHDSED